MFCMNCGTQLPDTAKFCVKCGAQTTPAAAEPQPEEVRLETCEIVFAVARKPLFGEADLRFEARAAGPNGTYKAGESSTFKGPQNGPEPGDPRPLEALNELVKALTRDGWQPQGSGLAWYHQKFQRALPPRAVGDVHNVLILSCGKNKIEVIKTIRLLTQLGLAEAKHLSETPGAAVLAGVDFATATNARLQLEASGATVEIH